MIWRGLNAVIGSILGHVSKSKDESEVTKMDFILLLIDWATLLGGSYELLADGTIMTNDLLGMLSGCNEVTDKVACVESAVSF